jgi:organic radical activating enzyme
LGERHIFIRFPVCDLHCDFCDELGKPMHEILLAEILEEVRQLERDQGPHQAVSLTGGEPLLYVPVLKLIGPRLRDEGFRILLETHGALFEKLTEVLALVDVISMDIKLPSVTKDRDLFREHREFLRRSKGKELYVKIVISKEASPEEFLEGVRLLAEESPERLLVLQPITIHENERFMDRELLSMLMEFQRMALRFLSKVQIIPRLHKILQIQ